MIIQAQQNGRAELACSRRREIKGEQTEPCELADCELDQITGGLFSRKVMQQMAIIAILIG